MLLKIVFMLGKDMLYLALRMLLDISSFFWQLFLLLALNFFVMENSL